MLRGRDNFYFILITFSFKLEVVLINRLLVSAHSLIRYLFPSRYISSAVLSHHFARTKYIYIYIYIYLEWYTKNSLIVKTFEFFISLHTYKKLQRVSENEKEKVSCIAVFQISFQPTGSRAEVWGENNQKIRSKGRSLFNRPFACICIYNVVSVVHQNIGLLIKLFVVVV